MANNTIRIIVVDGGKDYNYSKKSSEEKKEKQEEKEDDGFHPIQDIKNKFKKASPLGFYAAQLAVASAKQVVSSAKSYYHSGIGLSSGDSNYQAIVNNAVQIVEDSASAIKGMIGGFSIGMTVGGPVGAAIGMSVSLISSAIDYMYKERAVKREFDFQMWKDGVSQSYGLARANYSIYTGRKV